MAEDRSRSGTRLFRPDFIICRIEEVLEKNLTFIDTEAKKAGYTLHTHYDSKLPEIMADKDMLYQAFLNILINAMQSMPQGGDIQINITAKGNSVKIQFLDEGEGIAQEITAKIWDPFFTTKEKGTGLGLGIVKNIIESHNGIIQIENRPGKGVVVTVEL